MHNNKLMSLAGIAVALSGGLHWSAILIAPAVLSIGALSVIGLVYLGFAYGLNRQKRWLAYFCFIVMLIGSMVCLAASFESWVYRLITSVNVGSVILLFLALWQDRPQQSV